MPSIFKNSSDIITSPTIKSSPFSAARPNQRGYDNRDFLGAFLGRDGRYGQIPANISFDEALVPGTGSRTDSTPLFPSARRKIGQARVLGYAGQAAPEQGGTFTARDFRQGTVGGIQQLDRSLQDASIGFSGPEYERLRTQWENEQKAVPFGGVKTGFDTWLKEHQRTEGLREAFAGEAVRLPEIADQYRAVANLGEFGPAGLQSIQDNLDANLNPIKESIEGRLPQILDQQRRARSLQTTAAARGLAENVPSRLRAQPGALQQLIGGQVLPGALQQEAAQIAELQDRYGGQIDDINLGRADFLTNLQKQNIESKSRVGLAGLERTTQAAMQAFFGLSDDQFRRMEAPAQRAFQERMQNIRLFENRRSERDNRRFQIDMFNAQQEANNRFGFKDFLELGTRAGAAYFSGGLSEAGNAASAFDDGTSYDRNYYG